LSISLIAKQMSHIAMLNATDVIHGCALKHKLLTTQNER